MAEAAVFTAFHAVSYQATKKRAAAEELTKLLSLRAKLELSYSAELEKLSALNIDIADTGTLADALLALKRDLLNKASHARQLADNILCDLVEPLKECLTGQKQDLVNALYEPKHLEKERNSKAKTQALTKARYYKSCAELTKLEIKIDSAKSDFKKNKLLVKKMNLLQEQETSRELYKASVREINENLAQGKEQAQVAQELIIVLDKALYEGVKDALRKLVVYETSWLRSVQYDVEAVATAMESINVQADLDAIPRVSEFAVTEIEYEEYDGVLINPSSLPYTVEPEGKIMNRFKSWMGGWFPGQNKQELKVVSNLETIADAVWCKGSISPEYKAVLTQLLTAPPARNAFCSYLERRIESGSYVVPAASFLAVGEFIEIALSAIDKDCDYRTFNRILTLVNSLSKERDSLSEPRIYVREAVLEHNVWKNMILWDSYALDTIDRELRVAQNYHSSQDSQRNSVFCQLGAVSEILKTYRVPTEFIEELINKFAVRYDLSDEDIATLICGLTPSSEALTKKAIRGVPGWVHEIDSSMPSRQQTRREADDFLDFS